MPRYEDVRRQLEKKGKVGEVQARITCPSCGEPIPVILSVDNIKFALYTPERQAYLEWLFKTKKQRTDLSV